MLSGPPPVEEDELEELDEDELVLLEAELDDDELEDGEGVGVVPLPQALSPANRRTRPASAPG